MCDSRKHYILWLFTGKDTIGCVGGLDNKDDKLIDSKRGQENGQDQEIA